MRLSAGYQQNRPLETAVVRNRKTTPCGRAHKAVLRANLLPACALLVQAKLEACLLRTKQTPNEVGAKWVASCACSTSLRCKLASAAFLTACLHSYTKQTRPWLRGSSSPTKWVASCACSTSLRCKLAPAAFLTIYLLPLPTARSARRVWRLWRRFLSGRLLLFRHYCRLRALPFRSGRPLAPLRFGRWLLPGG